MPSSPKYTAGEKFETVCAFWDGLTSGPEEPLRDRLGRPLIKKWEEWAREFGARYGSRLFDRVVERGDAGTIPTPALAMLRQEDRVALWSVGKEFLTRIRQEGLKKDLAIEGVDPAVTDDLRRLYRAGIIDALSYTHDEGELPTLERLADMSGRSFPVEYMTGHRSALCLFSSAAHGVADVIRVYQAGIKDVTLVDNNAETMVDMRAIYPAHWTYAVSDYRVFIDEALARGTTYDLVLADTPNVMFREVGWGAFPKTLRLFDRIFIQNYGQDMLDELGWDGTDRVQLSRAIGDKFGCSIEVLQVSRRNAEVLWVVLGKR